MRLATAVAVLVIRAFTVPLIIPSQLKANLTVPVIPKLFTKLFNENGKSHSGAAAELESVPYETINDKKRLYPSAKYVCTTGSSKVHKSKRRGVNDGKMFNKLFAYIDGHNSEAQKIEMTVPVITKMSVSNYDRAPVTKTMCFYIPKKFQDNPPTPNNPEVFILKINETILFVKTFMGLSFTDTISDSVWINVRETFMEEMEDMDVADKVDQNHFYTAVYDFPMNSGSKYEVMLEEKSTDANVTNNADVNTEDKSEKLPRSFMLPTGDCPDGWEDFGGVNCYKFFLGASVTWVEARGACLLELGSDGYNADLASVHSQAEADLLGARVASMNMNRPWIGMVRNQGSLVWTDGSALDFENWKNGEPNNWGGREHCGHILNDWSGKWNDNECDNNFDYICMTSKRQRCAGRNFNGLQCCTPENPCGYGKGDCDGHRGCQGDLVCGSNNCMKFGTYYHKKDDCCDLPETLAIPETLGGLEPPPGQRCAGRNYNGRRCCTPEAPCDEGEGDCDGPGDGGSNDGHRGCKGDLVCGSNNCLQFGAYYHEKDDCCERPLVQAAVPLEPPAGQRCAEYCRGEIVEKQDTQTSAPSGIEAPTTASAPTCSLSFGVKAKSDAHILLASCDGCDGIEIVIGGSDNTQSYIRSKKLEYPLHLVKAHTPKIIRSETEFTKFWIQIKKFNDVILISVGNGNVGEGEPFMATTVSKKSSIEFVAFAGWADIQIKWDIHFPNRELQLKTIGYKHAYERFPCSL